MIVFLTLLYIGLLLLLFKLKILRPTLFWKLSPLVWMALLLFVLFIPMQWGAPAGPVNVYQAVIEIVPNVNGEVVEVPIDGLTPLKEGDVLFRIDPEPFEDEVEVLEAQLAEAQQNVKQLEVGVNVAEADVRKAQEEVEVVKSEQDAAAAAVTAAGAAVSEAETNFEKSKTLASNAETQLASARKELDRIETLVERNAAARSDLDRATIQFTNLQSQLDSANAAVRVAEQTVARAKADLAAAEAKARTVDVRLKQLIDAELPRVKAVAEEARLAAEARIGDEHPSVARIRAELEKARFDLKNTTVRAPSDGYVIGLTLRPGQRVAALPLRSYLSFVSDEQTTLAVGIDQNQLRYIAPGQRAEVSLRLYPGRIIGATVERIAYVAPQGQLSPGGAVPTAPGTSASPIRYGVRLKLDEQSGLDVSRLPGGTAGQAAIYTDKAGATHVIRKVMLRMDAWLNYVKSW